MATGSGGRRQGGGGRPAAARSTRAAGLPDGGRARSVVDERQVAELRRLAPTRAELSEVCEILDAAHAEVLGEVLRALANPTRLRLVAYLLCRGESTVGELARELGTAQAATSQALGALRLGGQVCVRRAGGFRYYSAAVPELAVLLTCLSRCCRLHVRAPFIAASGGAGEVR